MKDHTHILPEDRVPFKQKKLSEKKITLTKMRVNSKNNESKKVSTVLFMLFWEDIYLSKNVFIIL